MGDKLNILLVDDQPGKLLTYEAILAGLGENLMKARSGREALDLLLKNEVALILLDVNMPELSGFEVADIIHDHPRFRDATIVFVSAVSMTDTDRLQGYRRGAVDYISAPINPELLLAKVKMFCSLHRKTRELEAAHNHAQFLSRRMLFLQDDERRRFARDLHDGLGQLLTAAKMALDSFLATQPDEKITQATSFVDDAIKQVRSLSFLLHPPTLEFSGLGSAIRVLVEGLTERSGIDISVEIRPEDFPRFPIDLETAVYRIIQEALNNVFRHSETRKASVSLRIENRRIIARVRDYGKGLAAGNGRFQIEKIGVGIAGMTQRAKEFCGEFSIRNADPGTFVEVTIPVSAAAEDPAQVVERGQ